MKMKEKFPEIINTFVNYLWVNIPKEWIVQCKYEKYFLFINVLADDPLGKKPFAVRRRYSSDIIKKFEDNIVELAEKSAEEIIKSMKKKI